MKLSDHEKRILENAFRHFLVQQDINLRSLTIKENEKSHVEYIAAIRKLEEKLLK